jgi:hypothetical protein
MSCSRWSQLLDGNFPASRAYSYPGYLPRAQRGVDIDHYCRHNDVDLDTNEDHHAISCNHCGRWWRCYGQFADIWTDFIRYGRMDGSDPSTVNIVCSPKAWHITDNKVETEEIEYSFSYGGGRLRCG